MTTLRKEAIAMVETLPEENLPFIIHAMRELNRSDVIAERNRKEEAYVSLKKMIRPIPDLDEEKALAEYREERYGL